MDHDGTHVIQLCTLSTDFKIRSVIINVHRFEDAIRYLSEGITTKVRWTEDPHESKRPLSTVG